MKNETKIWFKYFRENFESAKILLNSKLFNPCLQNVQQSVEKALKTVLIENDILFKKTHDILELKILLSKKGIDVNLSDEDCDFLNSIYLPSKYPLGSVIPDYDPDEDVCKKAIKIAANVNDSVSTLLEI